MKSAAFVFFCPKNSFSPKKQFDIPAEGVGVSQKTEFPKKAKVFQQKVNSLVQTNTTNTSTNTPNNNFLLNLPKWAKSVGLTNEKAGEFGVVAVSNVSSWLLEQLKKISI